MTLTQADADDGSNSSIAVGTAPIIVLTYPHSRAEVLFAMLGMQPGLICTSATGILPLCDYAISTWRKIDGRVVNQVSPIGITSTRTLANSMMISILTRHNGRRWCEFATALPGAADAFIRVYPETRVVCLYRSCLDVITDALTENPWGLIGTEYAPYISAYPGNIPAALVAYWVTRTTALLEFEESHGKICRGLRAEDLGDTPRILELSSFLGAPDLTYYEIDNLATTDIPHKFPIGNIPDSLLLQANTVAMRLGYRPISDSSTT